MAATPDAALDFHGVLRDALGDGRNCWKGKGNKDYEQGAHPALQKHLFQT